ncbi:MAG: hypothetical protein KQH63_14570 [Desulfobulbaceae bacterium]|nr:hypothetical protein [Desulfobulbaceae bacterium]
MTKDKVSCEICGKKVISSSLCQCKGCGKNYCPKCQSPSSNQQYCKECVNLSGVVPHK